MSKITLDLAKNPDLAALVADKQPGDKVVLYTSIQDNNPQTVTLTLEECEEGEHRDDEEGNSDEAEVSDDEKPTPAPEKKPEKSYGRRYMEAAGISE